MKFIVLFIRSKYCKFEGSFEITQEIFAGAFQFMQSSNDEKLIQFLKKNKYLIPKHTYSIFRSKTMIKINFYHSGHIFDDQPCLQLITYKNYKAVSYRKEFNEFLKIKPEKIMCQTSANCYKLSSIVENKK